VARLVERHAVLAGPVPVPPVLASTDDGVVVLPGLPGTPMRALLSGDGTGLPGATVLDALLDALPAGAAEVSRRGRSAPGDALARVADHAAVLGAVAGHLRPRLDALTSTLAAADPGMHPPVPVHGDFYESQLLVDDGAVVGLLDVDTVGRGHRIDDWATLLGHLVLLERILPQPATVARYRAELEAHALGRWPEAQLRTRIAAVLVGLATGPFRVQQAGWPSRTEERIALAEEWAAASAG
jgi:aminoglycoside phosphotransferase (APT) family kinase protein